MHTVYDAKYPRALTGRNRQSIPNVPFIKLRGVRDTSTVIVVCRVLVAPFQGSFVLVFRSAGRCPGLTCGCPFGANNDRKRFVLNNQGDALSCHEVAPVGATRDHTCGADRGKPRGEKCGLNRDSRRDRPFFVEPDGSTCYARAIGVFNGKCRTLGQSPSLRSSEAARWRAISYNLYGCRFSSTRRP